ncbi:MAG: SOS response-associated peptidase [Smithella sp.]
MCGRFFLISDLTKIAEEFVVEKILSDFVPDRNISPGQYIPVLVNHNGQNILASLRWGLIPSWAKDASIGHKMINARAETIAVKPSFKKAFQKRRCLIPADGFYEWQKSGKVKKPFCISLKSGEPFGLAGLYETWMSPEKIPVQTCTIITTEANELIQSIHDRMPVIVKKEFYNFWLDPDNHNEAGLLAILKPYLMQEMTMIPADPFILNRPGREK